MRVFYLAARKGHIGGTKNLTALKLLNDGMRFESVAEYRSRYMLLQILQEQFCCGARRSKHRSRRPSSKNSLIFFIIR